MSILFGWKKEIYIFIKIRSLVISEGLQVLGDVLQVFGFMENNFQEPSFSVSSFPRSGAAFDL
jgi:hypothetical protein